MPRSPDPRALLDRHEAHVRARLARKVREVVGLPAQAAPAALAWVRKHPRSALAAAAGSGYFLAPARGPRLVARLERLGKVLLVGPLMRWVAKAIDPLRSPVPPAAKEPPSAGPRTQRSPRMQTRGGAEEP